MRTSYNRLRKLLIDKELNKQKLREMSGVSRRRIGVKVDKWYSVFYSIFEMMNQGQHLKCMTEKAE